MAKVFLGMLPRRYQDEVPLPCGFVDVSRLPTLHVPLSKLIFRPLIEAMTTDTAIPPRFERFRVAYPSGTTFDSHWPGGATLREVELAHPMAIVEPVSDSRVSAGAETP